MKVNTSKYWIDLSDRTDEARIKRYQSLLQESQKSSHLPRAALCTEYDNEYCEHFCVFITEHKQRSIAIYLYSFCNVSSMFGVHCTVLVMLCSRWYTLSTIPSMFLLRIRDTLRLGFPFMFLLWSQDTHPLQFRLYSFNGCRIHFVSFCHCSFFG